MFFHRFENNTVVAAMFRGIRPAENSGTHRCTYISIWQKRIFRSIAVG